MTLKFDGWPRKIIRHLFYITSSFAHHFKSTCEFKLELQSGNAKFGSNRRFFSRVTFKFDVWPWKTIEHLFYASSSFMHALFHSNWWIQTGVTVRKRQILVKIDDFFSRVTLQFDVWHWKTIGHLLYATSSFVHHFVATGEFKLELQSENAQWGSNSTICFSRVTFKFDGWPWKTIGHIFYATSNFVHHNL